MLVPMRCILETTETHDYAAGAFNVNAVCQAEAAVRIHEIFHAPAILQGADLANGFMGGRTDFMNATLEDKRKGAKNIADAVKRIAQDSPIPIALHLDHGRDFDSVKAAIDAGYTSVMIDGSSLPLEENIELTREVVKYAHERGVTVEGELGVLAGVEDHVFSLSSTYTRPLDGLRFFKDTGVDALAISYGTMHGASKGRNAVLRKEIAIAIKELLRHEGITGFLVSHGSSTVPKYIVDEIDDLGGRLDEAHGIPLDQLKAVSHMGIAKINVDTDIRLAVTRNVRLLFTRNPELKEDVHLAPVWKLMDANPKAFDPRVYLAAVMDTVMYGTIPSESVRMLTDAIRDGVMEGIGRLLVEFDQVGKARFVQPATLDEMAKRYRKAGI